MGILRFALALDVLFWHLPLASMLYPVPPLIPHSFIAVCVFFMISGFYMSLVLNETYRPGLIGTADFFINRALRIFIPYLAVLFVSIVLAMPSEAENLNPFYPQGDPFIHVLELLYNVFLIPAAFNLMVGHATNLFLLFGQMYTVGLELMFYCLAPWIVRRPLPILLALFLVSTVLHFLPYELGLPPRPWQYEFFPAVLMFFLLGSLSYRLYVVLKHVPFDARYGWMALPVIAGFSISGVLHGARGFTDDRVVLSFYFMVAVLLPALFLAAKSVTWDRFIGDLSYPLYIVHMPVLMVVGAHRHGELLIVSWAIGLSLCIVLLVERPVDKWRHSLSAARWLKPNIGENAWRLLGARLSGAAVPRVRLARPLQPVAISALVLIALSGMTMKILARPPVKFVAQDGSYRIVEQSKVYYAIPPGAQQANDDLSGAPGVMPDYSLNNLTLRVDSINSGQPKLLKVMKSYNVVVFRGKFFGVPFGLPIDWTRDNVAKLPGVISDDGERTVESSITARMD